MTLPTPRQREFEKAFKRLTKDEVAPSFKEMAAELGITYAAARALAVGLQRRGRLRMVRRSARSVELISETA